MLELGGLLQQLESKRKGKEGKGKGGKVKKKRGDCPTRKCWKTGDH